MSSVHLISGSSLVQRCIKKDVSSISVNICEMGNGLIFFHSLEIMLSCLVYS